MPKRLLVFSLLLLTFGLGACTHVYTARGAYYRVRQGDTLDSIAKRYKTEAQDLAEVNNIESPDELKPGTSIYIPGVTPSKFAAILKKEGIPVSKREKKKDERKVAKKEEKKKEAKEKNAEKKSEEPIEAGKEEGAEEVVSSIKTDRGRFIWPVDGEVSSLFGMRHGRRHDGVDIRAKIGTPVYASADGEVVYAKKMRGYGNLVLLKHAEDFFSVYAHNSVNLVKVGAKIRKGQLVSRVGRTGRATGPHLHFEIREGAKARNPLFFLPKTRSAEKAKQKNEVLHDDEGGEEGHEEEGGFGGETETENP